MSDDVDPIGAAQSRAADEARRRRDAETQLAELRERMRALEDAAREREAVAAEALASAEEAERRAHAQRAEELEAQRAGMDARHVAEIAELRRCQADQAARFEQQLADLRAELRAIEATLTFRVAGPFRRVYGAVRRRVRRA